MALEATHIFFAADTARLLGLHYEDAARFFSGTIYPDSRYVSKIDRQQTHPSSSVTDLLQETDDFQKGWKLHLLCDHRQTTAFGHAFSELFAELPPNAQGNITWQMRAALKILQDMTLVQTRPIAEYLDHLSYANAPAGEAVQDIEKYNGIVRELYGAPVTLDRYVWMWEAFGQGGQIVDAVRKLCEDLQRQEHIMAQLLPCYDEMLTHIL